MRIVESIGACRSELDPVRRSGRRIAFVPTMGYLHDGHLALVDRARELADHVVMSIFVNPIQFDSEADLAAYPRDLARDLGLAEAQGVDLVFAPPVDEMYPEPPKTKVTMTGVVEGLEGAARPGHLEGVLTVVTKLFHVVQPDVAVFGQKDAQQSAAVRRLVADLDFPIAIEVVPTVRETDGLAASSRNARLSAEQRHRALALPQALAAARTLHAEGENRAEALAARARQVLEAAEGVEPEYAAVVDRDTFEPVDRVEGPCVLAVAARVGPVRLIDNIVLEATP